MLTLSKERTELGLGSYYCFSQSYLIGLKMTGVGLRLAFKVTQSYVGAQQNDPSRTEGKIMIAEVLPLDAWINRDPHKTRMRYSKIQ